MKRFALPLSDEDFYAFMAAYPGHGARTDLLRRVVQRLIKRAKEQRALHQVDFAAELADEVVDRATSQNRDERKEQNNECP